MPLASRLPNFDAGLSQANFARLASILSARLGIKLPEGKRSMLEMRLRPRLRELGFASHDDYCRHLFAGNTLLREMQYLVDAVTTNKTDFFRESEHFDVLRMQLVPEIIAARKREGMPLIKLWSAAASSGAEAYTIAMVLEELQRSRRDFRYAIMGTDVSAQMIDQAVDAVYSAEMVTPVPAAMKERYMLASVYAGSGAAVRIVPELRRKARFFLLNLMDAIYPVDRDVDVIFLRNVLIYFERADQEAVIQKLLGHLRPGGTLILGHAEASIGTGMGLNEVAPGAFRAPGPT